MGTLSPAATVAQFESQFNRDFSYGPGLDKVRPLDIQNALNQASGVFNPSLFSTQKIGVPPNETSEALIAYLNCSAHFLVLSIQNVGGLNQTPGGGLNSQGEGITSSKSVGGVSISYQWPSFVTDSGVLFNFTKTSYGIAYLQVLMTRLVGNIAIVGGEPSPGGLQGGVPEPGFFGQFPS